MRGRPFLIISVLALFAISCGEIEKALQETEKTWRGTWRVATVTLDGENQPAYSAVWTLNDNEWRLVTAVCEASGPLSSNGNDLSLTVGATTCQPTLPAPQGRTASGHADVSGDSMTLSLSHDLDGVTHTLVTMCVRA